MKVIFRVLMFGAVATSFVAMQSAVAQSPDNPDRKKTTRQRENPERRDQPAQRNNPDREDPLLSAELQKCYAVPEAEKEPCITAVKRKFGEL